MKVKTDMEKLGKFIGIVLVINLTVLLVYIMFLLAVVMHRAVLG